VGSNVKASVLSQKQVKNSGEDAKKKCTSGKGSHLLMLSNIQAIC